MTGPAVHFSQYQVEGPHPIVQITDNIWNYVHSKCVTMEVTEIRNSESSETDEARLDLSDYSLNGNVYKNKRLEDNDPNTFPKPSS